ncbi:hypothetical protein AB0H82_07205 [Streptomyces sp. NPDC050732]|uniref:hypothetical protein n=1 Tax=Streptomyces sp. NPDC050732 TaxID=3154632 RepID=UPI003444EA7E
MHRAHGPYGKAPRLSRPEPSSALIHESPVRSGESPLARPILHLREHHADYTKRGYTRPLIPPGVVRLDTEEHPPHHRLPHPELMEAFIGAAPHTPQPLESAITAFRASCRWGGPSPAGE